MRNKWLEFEQLTTATNRKYNVHESLTPKEIEDTDASRKKILEELEALKNEMMEKMGTEISNPNGP